MPSPVVRLRSTGTPRFRHSTTHKADPQSGETETDAGRTEQACRSGRSSDNLYTRNRQRTDSWRALQGLWVGYPKTVSVLTRCLPQVKESECYYHRDPIRK